MCMKNKKYEVLKNFDYYYSNGNKFQSFRKQDVIELLRMLNVLSNLTNLRNFHKKICMK